MLSSYLVLSSNLRQGVVWSSSYRVLLSQLTVGMFPCLFGLSPPPSPSRSDSQDRLNKALSFNAGVLEVSDTNAYTDTAGCLCSLPDVLSLRGRDYTAAYITTGSLFRVFRISCCVVHWNILTTTWEHCITIMEKNAESLFDMSIRYWGYVLSVLTLLQHSIFIFCR